MCVCVCVRVRARVCGRGNSQFGALDVCARSHE
jgi:hypothetical protein